MPRREDHTKSDIEHSFAPEDQSPATHFLYEYEGDRDVDLDILTENGIYLWHELAASDQIDDVEQLWTFAEDLLEKSPSLLRQSRVESIRQRIIFGAISLPGWGEKKFHRHKNTLISAIYFHEARKLCNCGASVRATHIIATAYYFLGLGSTRSVSHSMALQSATRHAQKSEFRRAIVLEVLRLIEGNPRVTSVEKAKDEVIRFIAKKDALKKAIDELDKLSTGVKHSPDNDALTRLQNALDDWAKPNGPYPEIYQAFAKFSSRKASQSKVISSTESVGGEAPPWDPDSYLRIVNFLESGGLICLALSRNPVDSP